MVDISKKDVSTREARATARVKFKQQTFKKFYNQEVIKVKYLIQQGVSGKQWLQKKHPN